MVLIHVRHVENLHGHFVKRNNNGTFVLLSFRPILEYQRQ